MARATGPDRRMQDDPQRVQEAMEDEANSSWPVYGTALMTRGQARGGALGVLVGLLAGGVVGGLLAALPILDMAMWLRLAVFVGVCATAGSVIGAIVGGGWNPDREGETGQLPGEAPRSVGRQRSGHAE